MKELMVFWGVIYFVAGASWVVVAGELCKYDTKLERFLNFLFWWLVLPMFAYIILITPNGGRR